MSKDNNYDLLFYKGPYVVFDTESTSLHPNDTYGKLTEIGAVKMIDGHIVDTFSMLIDPECRIPKSNIQLTGITEEMVKGQPKYPEVIRKFKEFCGDECILVMHNAPHDLEFMDFFSTRCGVAFNYPTLDTLPVSRSVYPKNEVMDRQHAAKASYKLNDLCNMLGINDPSHHRAWNDAKVTGLLMNEMKKRIIEQYPQYQNVSFDYKHFTEREISNAAYHATPQNNTHNKIRKGAKVSSLKMLSCNPWIVNTERGEVFRIYFNLCMVVEGRTCKGSVYFDVYNQTWGVKTSPVELPNDIFDCLGRIYMQRHDVDDMNVDTVRKVVEREYNC